MNNNEIAEQPTFIKTISINRPIETVWHALTDIERMKQWMSETPIDIITDWKVGAPFIIRGQHYKMKFENKGRVLQFVPNQLIEYNHLSSISRLKDEPKNYTVFRFELAEAENHTILSFRTNNFPTETIYKHLAFYWNVTLEKIKKQAEAEL